MAEKSPGVANDGADEFANALRNMVFEASKEAAHLAVEPVLEEMSAMEGRLGGRIDATNERIDATNERIDATNERIDATNARIDTTNQNMQAQLAQHRKDVSEDVRKILSEMA